MRVIEFLEARLAEDEAGEEMRTDIRDGRGIFRTKVERVPPSPRALAEVESKRHLLDEALVWGEGCLDVMARYMAEVYADHPAYDEAWRP